MKDYQTCEELEADLIALKLDGDQKAQVTCSLIGHSRMVRMFWGQVSCCRCGDVIGDTLMSIYDLSDKAILGHDCEECEKIKKSFTWKDTYLLPKGEEDDLES